MWPCDQSWRISCHLLMGFPDGSNGKESACNAGDLGSIPGSGRSLREGIGNPLVFLPGEFHGQRAWQATVYAITKCRTRLRDQLSLSLSLWKWVQRKKKTGNILLLSASSGLRQMPVVILDVFKGLLDGMFLFFPHPFTLLSSPFISSLLSYSFFCPEKELYILDISL